MAKRIEHIFDDNGTELKWCSKCEEWKLLNKFPKDKRALDGLYSYCKICESKRGCKRQKENPEYKRVYCANRRANNPEFKLKYDIRALTNNAIARGELIRPDVCELCGFPSDRIQAHHHSYDPKDYLDVTFLCVPCHMSVHRQLKLENPMFEDDDIDQLDLSESVEETIDLVADNVVELRRA